jgi:hypothetical protein
MGRACNSYGKEYEYVQFPAVKPEGNRPLGIHRVGGRITLKLIIEK